MKTNQSKMEFLKSFMELSRQTTLEMIKKRNKTRDEFNAKFSGEIKTTKYF